MPVKCTEISNCCILLMLKVVVVVFYGPTEKTQHGGITFQALNIVLMHMYCSIHLGLHHSKTNLSP